VDVRLLEVNGRWIASADTVDGVVGELLASLPAAELGD
jgi:hypothetical protein